MDEADTWHGGRPQPRRLCVRWGPSPLPQNGQSPLPNFKAILILMIESLNALHLSVFSETVIMLIYYVYLWLNALVIFFIAVHL